MLGANNAQRTYYHIVSLSGLHVERWTLCSLLPAKSCCQLAWNCNVCVCVWCACVCAYVTCIST